jgi:hypothetical protein
VLCGWRFFCPSWADLIGTTSFGSRNKRGGFRAVTLNTGYEPKSYMRVEEAAILLILSWGVSYYLRNVIEFLAYVITTVYWGDASLP